MISELEQHLRSVDRAVVSRIRDGAPAHSLVLTRVYDTAIDDLWDAVTNEQRLPRWFAGVTGDLHLGGRYQVENNASGEIVMCEAPNGFVLTWELSGDVSWVDVALAANGPESARLTLMHTSLMSPHWEQYGPGAAGVGWELGFIGLARHIADPEMDKWDEEAFAANADGKAYMRESSKRWGEAAINGGEDQKQARAAALRTAAFYTGDDGTS